MLAYTADNEHEAIALSVGVRNANTLHDLGLFHQIGSYDLVGFHGWEIWKLGELQDRHLEQIADFATSEAIRFFERVY
jgi:hypothetical protein